MADRLAIRDNRFYLLVPVMAVLIAVPLTYAVLLADRPYVALALNVFPAFFQTMYMGPALASSHALVGVRSKAVSSAVLFFVLNLIGLGFGPLTVGAVSDYLQPEFGTDSLRIALLSVITIVGVWCVTHYAMAARTFMRDVQQTIDSGA